MPVGRTNSCLLLLLLALHGRAAAAPAGGGRGAGFRGDGTGRYPDARPPRTWDRTKNVAWSTALPAWGNATPVPMGDCVIVTFEPTSIACVAREGGALRWKREIGYLDTVPPSEMAMVKAERAQAEAVAAELQKARAELDGLRRDLRKKGATPEVRARVEALSQRVNELKARHDGYARFRPPEPIEIMGSASSTPVTDGKTAFAIFGNEVVAAVGIDGKLRWARHLPVGDVQMNGFGKGQAASPLLVGDRVIVPLGRLQALDAATGATRWTGEPYRDYGSPVLARAGGDDVIVTPSGDVVRARDGKTLATKLDYVLYVGPTVQGDVVFFAGNIDSNPPDPARATAWRMPAQATQPLSPQRLWQVPLAGKRRYATPLAHDGHLFLVDETGALTILDAASGRFVERRELRLARPFPSPTLAGEHLYVSGEDGTTVVLSAKAPFREVARNTLEPMRASPIFVGTRMYVRTLERLYCIEER